MNEDVKVNVLEELFLFYFVGMVVSRIGSIIIEPICKKTKFVQYAEYSNYLDAINIDHDISVLLEANNMYRTFLSGMILILLFKVSSIIVQNIQFTEYILHLIIIVSLALLFAFSYRKQTSYIKKRIEKALKRNKSN